MSEIIFHHYWQSPVAHKVRTVLGIKNLTWNSVEIPRVPPKPDLMPLTGGYRRTPVMQIGADIYCDSQCIMHELQRRYPEPTLYPGGADGMAWGIARWTDAVLFNDCVGVVLGHQLDKLPPDFAADRLRLYFGPDYDAASIAADLEHILVQVRGQLGWMNQRLAGGRQFMLGDAPGLPDAVAYYLVWFLRGRYADGPEFLAEFPHLEAWEQRVEAIGHGTPTDMAAEVALAVARDATSTTPVTPDPRDPQKLEPGMVVQIVPADDGGDPVVEGEVVLLSAQTIAIKRTDPVVGDVVVHFPRVGYRVSRS